MTEWLGIATPNFAMVGRWIAYMAYGQFYHKAIVESAPIRGEHVIGWLFHYLIVIAFAALLIGFWGQTWIGNPTLEPALIVGSATVIAPFLVMQPGMGSGIAASKTPKPAITRLHSVIAHAVFGLGLYLSGLAVKLLT